MSPPVRPPPRERFAILLEVTSHFPKIPVSPEKHAGHSFGKAGAFLQLSVWPVPEKDFQPIVENGQARLGQSRIGPRPFKIFPYIESVERHLKSKQRVQPNRQV